MLGAMWCRRWSLRCKRPIRYCSLNRSEHIACYSQTTNEIKILVVIPWVKHQLQAATENMAHADALASRITHKAQGVLDFIMQKSGMAQSQAAESEGQGGDRGESNREGWEQGGGSSAGAKAPGCEGVGEAAGVDKGTDVVQPLDGNAGDGVGDTGGSEGRRLTQLCQSEGRRGVGEGAGGAGADIDGPMATRAVPAGVLAAAVGGTAGAVGAEQGSPRVRGSWSGVVETRQIEWAARGAGRVAAGVWRWGPRASRLTRHRHWAHSPWCGRRAGSPTCHSFEECLATRRDRRRPSWGHWGRVRGMRTHPGHGRVRARVGACQGTRRATQRNRGALPRRIRASRGQRGSPGCQRRRACWAGVGQQGRLHPSRG